jgi:hypothetical protein
MLIDFHLFSSYIAPINLIYNNMSKENKKSNAGRKPLADESMKIKGYSYTASVRDIDALGGRIAAAAKVKSFIILEAEKARNSLDLG